MNLKGTRLGMLRGHRKGDKGDMFSKLGGQAQGGKRDKKGEHLL